MLREDMKDPPRAMKGRPVDHRGYLVPWFVTLKDKEDRWDFATVTQQRLAEAIRFKKCWVSGEKLGRRVAFVIGPMCTINRIGADGPVKPDVGHWSAKVCPFLSRPLAVRAEREDTKFANPGVMVTENPGICVVWVTDTHKFMKNKRLFHIGDPISATWYRNGVAMKPGEVIDHFDASAKRLQTFAAEEGEEAHRECLKMTADAMRVMGMTP